MIHKQNAMCKRLQNCAIETRLPDERIIRLAMESGLCRQVHTSVERRIAKAGEAFGHYVVMIVFMSLSILRACQL
jgi:hypothetical protein